MKHLFTAILLVLGLALAPAAEAATGRTTVVYSPHPDDDVLRLSAYINFAADRGDRMILVAVTDGGASGVRTKLGFTVPQFEAVRRAEQAAAWSYLTRGKGEIIRLSLPDGGVTGAPITAIARSLEGPGVEHYVAANAADYHRDHQATVSAVKNAGLATARAARPVGATDGSLYTVPSSRLWDVARASAAYREVGWVSVSSSFADLAATNYSSRVGLP